MCILYIHVRGGQYYSYLVPKYYLEVITVPHIFFTMVYQIITAYRWICTLYQQSKDGHR